MPIAVKERSALPLIRLIRHGQVTLPAKFRSALRLKEGDYLEAMMHENGIMLKPALILNRRQAIAGLHRLMDEVQSRNTRYNQKEVEQEVARAIREVRKLKA